MQHTFFVPRWRPPLANQWRGRHWSREHKLKRETIAMLSTYAHLAGVPRATGQRSVSLLVVLGPRQRKWDRDAADKVLLDSLVRCGLLTGDGEAGLKGRVEVEWAKGTAREWGARLTLTDC